MKTKTNIRAGQEIPDINTINTWAEPFTPPGSP